MPPAQTAPALLVAIPRRESCRQRAAGDDLTRLLDEAEAGVRAGRLDGVPRLYAGLREQWLRCPAGARAEFRSACRAHPLCGLLHQDPFTRRTFAKPRGYAGDAVMLDMLYFPDGRGAPAAGCTPLGERLFRMTTATEAPDAVRERREVLAGFVDRACAEAARPRVLAVAAGHLREAELSAAANSGGVGEYVALDQDAESLREVDRAYGRLGVRTHHASVRPLLTGRHGLGSFDAVYAAGLYDYLPDATARRLTGRLFGMLNPGGRLLVANFLPGGYDLGYMEGFMDWTLIYRTLPELEVVAAGIPTHELARRQSFTDPAGAVGYLTLTRN